MNAETAGLFLLKRGRLVAQIRTLNDSKPLDDDLSLITIQF